MDILRGVVQMAGKLLIGKTMIEDYGDAQIRYYVQVNDNGSEKELSFVADREFAQYFVVERSDAFVIALLYYAMFNGLDIEWETPCSERLIYQISTYYIPVIAQNYEFMHEISLEGPQTSELLECEKAVGTGISCGVDSLYTIHKYLNVRSDRLRLTHIMLTDWFVQNFSEESQRDYEVNNIAYVKPVVEKMGLRFIFVHLDVDKYFSIGSYLEPYVDKQRGLIRDGGLYTLKYCSIALALGKLFSIYYFSSGYTPADFTFHKDDFSYHDILTLPLISTESLCFYSAGMEANRIDKIAAISEWEIAQDYLEVCVWKGDRFENCGLCPKCKRTMSELYVLGRLDLFSKRFPVEIFKKHLSRNLAFVFALEGTFGKAVRERAKEKNIAIPRTVWVWWMFYYFKGKLRLFFCTKSWARKLYLKFKLDKVIYGVSLEHMREKNSGCDK